MAQERIPRPSEHQEEAPPVEEDMSHARPAADLSEVDKLLDEIDDILEENAEEFVNNFQQRGGE